MNYFIKRRIRKTLDKCVGKSVVMLVTRDGRLVSAVDKMTKATVFLFAGDAISFIESPDWWRIETECRTSLMSGKLQFLRKTEETVLRTWVFRLDAFIGDAAVALPRDISALVPHLGKGCPAFVFHGRWDLFSEYPMRTVLVDLKFKRRYAFGRRP